MPDKVNWNELRLMAGATAVGGFGSWWYAWLLEDPLLPSWYFAIPAHTILGCIGGTVGIYLLVPIDTDKIRRGLAFALLCGFAWKPILDAGVAGIKQKVANEEIEGSTERSEDLLPKVEETPVATTEAAKEEVREQLTLLTDSVVRSVRRLPLTTSQTVRKKAQSTTDNAVRTITDLATRQPADNETGVKAQRIAVNKLRMLGVEGLRSKEKEVVNSSVKSLQALSRDPRIAPKNRGYAADWASELLGRTSR